MAEETEEKKEEKKDIKLSRDEFAKMRILEEPSSKRPSEKEEKEEK